MTKLETATKLTVRYFIAANLIMGVCFAGLVAVGGTAYIINNSGEAQIEHLRK